MEENITFGTVNKTHYCGEISTANLDEIVTLTGWVHNWRNLGNLIFIDLRDRTGIVQIVFSPEDSETIHNKASNIRNEFVIGITGKVQNRPEGMINNEMITGEIEVRVISLKILNTSKTPPFPVSQASVVNEELRLQYRYIDLRSKRMKNNIILRHKVTQITRDFLNRRNFLEIETPLLMRSTPEGARDFIVPSRLHPGCFYALPQSPQLYKQMLMISGMDRYYQIARCFRDEDSRGDKQPEHTQIDIEMSFITQEEIFTLAEGLFKEIFQKALQSDIPTPFIRIPYKEAMDRYGTDKPDIRFALELQEMSDIAAEMSFIVFKKVLETKGIIKGLRVPGGAKLSRKQIQNWENDIKTYFNAKGLAWVKVSSDKFTGPIAKFFDTNSRSKVLERFSAQEGDLLLFVAGKPKVVYQSLADLRLKTADFLDCKPKNDFRFAWITDFPLFDWNEDEEKWEAAHHLFTMPRLNEIELLETNPGKVHGQLYDLVLNGVELASGSIRIHNRELQEKILKIVGMTPEEADNRFGFFLKALEYGAPPHGGIAPGLDRILMLMAGENTIRDVIPFPKTLNAASPLDGSPSKLDENQLNENHIKIITKHG